MADQDKDQLAAAEHGAGDRPAAEGAVSTGEATASGDGAATAPGAAADQRGAESNGQPGAAEDTDPGAGGQPPDPAARPAAGEEGAATGGRADDDARAGDTADPQLPPGLAHRPAGFATGYAERDPLAYPGEAPADRGEGAGYEPGGEAAGPEWAPGEAAGPGAQASPYAPYGEYGPHPAEGYEGYGQPPGYGYDQEYGPERGYDQEYGYGPERGYAPPDSYGQAYPPPEYGEGPDYGPAGMYGEDEEYDAGYGPGPGYGPERPYGDDQAYARGYGPPQDYDQGYDQAQAYSQVQPGDQQQAAGARERDAAQGQGGGGDQNGGEARAGARPQSGGEAPAGAQPQGGEPRAVAQVRGGAQAQGYPQARPGAAGPAASPVQAPPGGRRQAQPGGREQEPGSAAPYPAQGPYHWPSPYEAPAQTGTAQAGPGPYDVPGAYGGQAPGRAGAGPATRPYGAETAYPPRPPQPAAPQAEGADTLAPLPAHAPEEQQEAAETADDLTAEALLHGKRQAPGAGWRRLVYKSSGGLIRPRESAETLRRRELIHRVRTPVAGGHHRVAVMSLKGGVGKTTTAVGLGAMLASLRGDRIIALDANPDRGTLSDKVRLETSATVRDMLNERNQIRRYADVRAFTSQAPSRLEVLASDRDPTVSVAFCEEDYYDAARVLEHYYSISLIDCGTGLLHSAMAGVLRLADQIILVSSPSVDGARSASATLDWLDAHAYGDLVRNGVVVLSMIRPRSKSTVDLDRLEHHFAGRCRAVVRIPYDGHLEEGAEVDLDQMSPATVDAYLTLAATVGDGFAWPRRAARQPAAQRDWDRRDISNGAARRYR